MLPPAPSPLWLDLVKATIGPVIAAIVFIVGLIWRDRIERRNAAQAWFEQTYVTDGLDLVINHLDALLASLPAAYQITLAPPVLPLSPHLVRRLQLFGHVRDFARAYGVAEMTFINATRVDTPIQLTTDEVSEIQEYCLTLLSIGEMLREVFLDINIERKKDVYSLWHDERIQNLIRKALLGPEGDLDLPTWTEKLQSQFHERMFTATTERRRLASEKRPLSTVLPE